MAIADKFEDTHLIAAFTDRIRQGLRDWYGNTSKLLSDIPELRCYTNSFVLRYVLTTPAGPRAILLKIRRNPKMDSLSQAIHARDLHTSMPTEFDNLRHVFERIGSDHERFAAIRPLAYFEDYFAIVMEEFPSHSLRHLLRRQRMSAAGHRSHSIDAQVIAHRAGELLRFFHAQVYLTAECPYSSDDVLADVKPYVTRLQHDTRGHIDAQSILDAFGERLARLETKSILYTKAHQDLTCDNVLYSEDGKVCLIDIKTKPAPIYSDLALLLIHPETFRNQIFSNGRYFSEQTLASYRDSILKGYFAKLPINESLVNIHCAIRILDKWSMHQELFHRYKGVKRILTRPLSPLVTSYFQGLLSKYLQIAG